MSPANYELVVAAAVGVETIHTISLEQIEGCKSSTTNQ
jgi:hypothetical protein